MRRTRVYVDTSVFGGIQDEEFREPSRRFFALIRKGKYLVLPSQGTLDELDGAPKKVQQVLASLPENSAAEVRVDAEVNAPAQAYIDAGVLSENCLSDAVHVAAASVPGAEVLLR